MEPTEPVSPPPAPPGDVPPRPGAPRPRVSPGLFHAIALACGLAAGLLAWAAGEAAYGAFKAKLFRQQQLLQVVIESTNASENEAEYKNATLAYALLGAATGLLLGFGGGLAARAPARGAAVGIAAALLGSMLGAGTSQGLLPLFFRNHVPDPNDLATPLLIHGGIWGSIGLVGGAAFAVGLGARPPQVLRAAIGGGLGAVLGTVLFHVLGGALFGEDSGVTSPLADESLARLLGRLLIPLLAAVGASRAIDSRPDPALKPAPLES